MNDMPSQANDGTSIPENAQLAQWHDEAAQAAAAPDLRERVRALTARILHERRMAFDELRDIVGAITAGAGDGLSARGGEIRDGLRQAVAGIDDAIGAAAQAATYSLREAVAHGREYRDTELRADLAQLRDLEVRFIDAVKHAASQSGGKLKEELGYLGDHLKHSGTRTGEQVRDALRQLAEGVKAGTGAGRAGVNEAASLASERLAQAASGVLDALADSLKRQSDRLRS